MDDMERMPRQEGQDAPDWDEQLLERVWARVMGGRPEADTSREEVPGNGERLMPPEGQSQPVPQQLEEQAALSARPCRPERRETACFGRDSRAWAGLLRRMIDGEGEDGRIYRALARRAMGNTARQLSLLARQEEAHARRLGAAYFILTGRRYRWAEQGAARPPVELMSGLREQLLQAGRESEAYAQAARESRDRCLSELFGELAGQEAEQARVLRELLEQM